MSQLLAADKTGNVLEVGTGSGYQAAVLCELFDQVYSIEIVPELGRRAKATLDRLGYTNIQTKIGDGYKGWPQHAPFDGILVTAAPNHIPKPLVDQLKPGGRMVIPVGDFSQDLLVVTKQDDGASLSRTVLPVRFVPLVRGRQQ
jgi:protein-L-isoaspartate(D-aspartate) O-methyltransferase